MIIASISYKGGVGKSTVARNLAVFIAEQGQKVCIIDADETMATTEWFADRQENEDTKKEDTVECSIFNRTAVAVARNYEFPTIFQLQPEKLLLFSGISEGYSNAGYAYSEQIYYTNQGYRNFYSFVMLLLGCFLFLVFSFVPFLRCISKLYVCIKSGSDGNRSGAKGMTELSNI